MKSLWQITKSHWEDNFNARTYFWHLVVLGLLITANYTFDIENGIFERLRPFEVRTFCYLLAYALVFFTSCFILTCTGRVKGIWTSSRFYLFAIVGLVTLALHSSFPYLSAVINGLKLNLHLYLWIFWIGNNVQKLLTVIVPLFIFYQVANAKSAFYGLTSLQFNVKPFLFILIGLIPLVYIASLDQGFRDYYPTYRPNGASAYLHWPDWVTMILYEISYSLDFISVELLFRGFFVIGMSALLGKDAILPMVSVYCVLHFGKPIGESISSILGGYLLGVIALSTRSIWGGIIIHVGLAWMMDFAAYLAKAP